MILAGPLVTVLCTELPLVTNIFVATNVMKIKLSTSTEPVQITVQFLINIVTNGIEISVIILVLSAGTFIGMVLVSENVTILYSQSTEMVNIIVSSLAL